MAHIRGRRIAHISDAGERDAPEQPTQPQRSDASPAERYKVGKSLRGRVPRSSHAAWSPPADRPDPVGLLRATDRYRQPDLVPIRYGRMLESPFAFLRGGAVVMAGDLASTPSTSIRVQACGDAHLSNFGSFGTPERKLVFDLNDFDETLPGPWEWDLKRLAASVMVAGRTIGFSAAACVDAVSASARAYREKMAMFAGMRYLDVLYFQKDAGMVLDSLPRSMRSRADLRFKQATKRDSLQALAKLTTVVDGQIRIAEVPPLVTHISDERMGDHLRELMQTYIRSLRDDIREFLQRYTIVDYARKVVGVGSVGTRCYIILLRGRDGDDPLFLQIKEATTSVLEPRLGRSTYANHGQRVVYGQRRIQAASDLFLGWGQAATLHYYIRQLRDMKGGAQVLLMTPAHLIAYAALCGGVLARAHARSGDAATISGYLGKGDAFDRAITAFADAYADQTERDHAALVAAVKTGRVVAESGT